MVLHSKFSYHISKPVTFKQVWKLPANSVSGRGKQANVEPGASFMLNSHSAK